MRLTNRENESRPKVLLLRKTLSQGHGFEHGFGFVHGLIEFPLRGRIIHPAATRLNISLAILDERSADGNAAVEIAVEGKITDTTAVGAALSLLQFGDDLH